METLSKIISLFIFLLIEIFVGWLLYKLTFCILGQAIFFTYCFIAFILAIIFAIGLDEGDF